MRIAILSDVHGNLTALETVLADVKMQSPDSVAFAGDLCFFGARPAACIERIKPDVDLFVYGNTDEFIFDTPETPADLEKDRNWQAFMERIEWYQQQLTPEQKGWLSRLPFSHRLSPTADAKDDLLIVHANPKDVNEPIAPPADEQEAALGEVKIKRDDETMKTLMGDVTADTIAYGHVHFPNVQTDSGITLANISCVSLPMTKDGKTRYAILTWKKGSGWEIERRELSYNYGKEQELLSFIQPPGWEMMSAGLGQ